VTIATSIVGPGNVRELRNVIARARVVAPGAVIDTGDLDVTDAAAASISRDDFRSPR
jgi:DNA-binding NtrC family response regulator